MLQQQPLKKYLFQNQTLILKLPQVLLPLFKQKNLCHKVIALLYGLLHTTKTLNLFVLKAIVFTLIFIF